MKAERKAAQLAAGTGGFGAKFRIILVDDHPITREGLGVLISQERNLTVCAEADNAPRALELAAKLNPDLAIIDLSLKTSSGIELIKNLQALRPKLALLVFSMHDEDIYAERALRAGARGYLMKLAPGDLILAAIHRVLTGEIYLSDAVKERILHRMVDGRKPALGFSIHSLSDRELEVFQLLGSGYSSRQIAAQLRLSVKTINSHREHLKLKLSLAQGSDLVRYAIEWQKLPASEAGREVSKSQADGSPTATPISHF